MGERKSTKKALEGERKEVERKQVRMTGDVYISCGYMTENGIYHCWTHKPCKGYLVRQL